MKYHIPFDIVLSKTSPLSSSLVVGRLEEAESSLVGGAAEVRTGTSARGRKLNKRISGMRQSRAKRFVSYFDY